MRVRLLTNKARPWQYRDRHLDLSPGTIVPVVPATNIPQTGDAIRLWIDTAALMNDPEGIGLYDGEYEVVSGLPFPEERASCDECQSNKIVTVWLVSPFRHLCANCLIGLDPVERLRLIEAAERAPLSLQGV